MAGAEAAMSGAREDRFHLASSDWVKPTAYARHKHEFFFLARDGCCACLVILISWTRAGHFGTALWRAVARPVDRRWHALMASERKRRICTAHDRSPLRRFGIRRRPSCRHDGCGRWLADDSVADPAVRRPPADGGRP